VDKNLIDLKTASSILDLPQQLFNNAEEDIRKLSFSSRRLFLTLFGELYFRDGCSLEEGQSKAYSLLRQKDPLTALRKLRYPQLSDLQRCLEEYRKRNVAGTGISLQVPDNFEGDVLRLSFDLYHKGQMQRRITDLKRIGETIDEVFDLLV
jgi:hypothetical protein